MTKAIAALMIALVLFGIWQLFTYYEHLQEKEEAQKKQEQQAVTMGSQLAGLPAGLEMGLQKAQEKGAEALGQWLKTYGQNVQDPRKAWIELDYVMLLSREHPAEARRLFAAVKSRVKESSPVYPRIKQLEKTYE